MSNRQFALKSKIGELIALLDTVQSKGIESVPVKIDTNETRTYTVGGLKDALNGLMAELISSPESIVPSLEERYEHDRMDVFRMVGTLAEIVASTATGVEYTIGVNPKTETKKVSTPAVTGESRWEKERSASIGERSDSMRWSGCGIVRT